MEGLRKIRKPLSQDSLSPERDLKALMERLGSELGTHFIVVSERVRLVTPSRSRDELCGIKA